MKLHHPTTPLLVPAALLTALWAPGALASGGMFPPAAVQETDAQEEYAALEAEANDAINQWRTDERARMNAAREAGAELPKPTPNPAGAYAPRFLAAAAKYAGKEGALPFLTWVLANGVAKDDVVAAAREIAKSHASSEDLAAVAGGFPRLGSRMGDADAARFFDELVAKSPSAAVKGWATYARYEDVFKNGDLASERFKELQATLAALVEEAADPRLTMTYQREVLVRVEFAIGAIAPDIVGKDLSNVEFKLSDYEGKVIFLDFWGNW